MKAGVRAVRYRILRTRLRSARRRIGAVDVDMVLQGRRQFEAMGTAAGIPAGTTCTPVRAGGVDAEWMTVSDSDPDRVLFYLHGGGYTMGSVNASRHGLSGFVRACRLTALNVDYRLAPEHRFPAAVDDAVAAYRWLVDRVAAHRIVVLGESAGGGLALAMLVALRDAGDPLPAGAATISAWADLDLCGPSHREQARHDLSLTPQQLRLAAQLYLGEADPRDPLASPVHADVSGLPPLLLLASTHEVVLDDTLAVAERVRAANGEVEVRLAPRMLHCWTGYPELVARAAGDVADVGRWLRERVSG